MRTVAKWGRMNRGARALGGLGACCLGLATMVPITAATASPHAARLQPKTAAASATESARLPRGAMRFSHEVVVDEQRSGFEPDVLIDSHDRMYTSVPNGSTQGTSYVWTSSDHGKSFHLVPGSILHGKPVTCIGGGDTELQLDKSDNVFLSDLQNLTNLSNSVSTNHGRSWRTTCVGAVNTPVDRMWYAVQGSLGDPNFAIYEEYDAVDSSATVGNQLVEEVSSNGLVFVPVTSPDFLHCLGGGVLNCVANDEGISGNQFVLPNGEVVIAHTSSDGNLAQVSYGTPVLHRVGGVIVGATAKWHTVTVNRSLCPDQPKRAPGICGAALFVTVTHDSAGNIYASFASAKRDAAGNQVGPYNVYVAISRNGGKTFGKPIQVSRGGSNAFSWVNAGSKGRVAVAWYHANESHEGKNGYAFDDLHHTEFSVQVGESINALSAHPKFKVSTVSEHPIKYGPICTQGTLCLVSGGDRSLGDFLEVSHDVRGALALSYVDDTSNTYVTGTAGIEENGPPVVVRQIHGPALVKGKRNPTGFIDGPGKGPGVPMDQVSDPAGDDVYSANGRLTPAGGALDLRGAQISVNKARTALVITMRINPQSGLAVPAAAGGTTGEWITRFTTYNPGTPGNGHVYYGGMQSILGGKPTFFLGDAASPTPIALANVQLSMMFSSLTKAQGSYDSGRGIITVKVPFSAVPGVRKHATLYSATAFSGTTLGQLGVLNASGVGGQINQTDATEPFNVVVDRAPSAHVAEHHGGVGATATSTPFVSALAAIGVVLIAGAVVLARRQRVSRPPLGARP
ncbi:MAG TPA: hypothetical protein VHE57_14650 [Mycobacteriales bacterium]|nr:hypothetical protein [Mycobacteriales bacterium]